VKNFLLILFGITLSGLAATLGLWLTKLMGDGTFVGLTIFISPIIGFVVFKKASKQVGLGLMIGGIILSVIALLVLMASGLH
jgi:hypothetical protein